MPSTPAKLPRPRATAMAEEKGLLLTKSLAESKRKDEELERLREEVSALKDKKSG